MSPKLLRVPTKINNTSKPTTYFFTYSGLSISYWFNNNSFASGYFSQNVIVLSISFISGSFSIPSPIRTRYRSWFCRIDRILSKISSDVKRFSLLYQLVRPFSFVLFSGLTFSFKIFGSCFCGYSSFSSFSSYSS